MIRALSFGESALNLDTYCPTKILEFIRCKADKFPMKSLLFFILLMSVSLSFAKAEEDIFLKIETSPSINGKFSETFTLTCKGQLCESQNSKAVKRKSTFKKSKIESELNSLIEMEKKEEAFDKNFRPSQITKRVSFISGTTKFESFIGTILDKNTKSSLAFNRYEKNLRAIIKKSLEDSK